MPTKQSKKDKERTVSSSDQSAQCGLCTNPVLMGTYAVECLACEQWFHQECSDLSETNIKAIYGLPSVHWYCRKCLKFATKLLKTNGLKSIIEKLDTLIQTNEQHQTSLLATDSEVEQSTNATCIASESNWDNCQKWQFFSPRHEAFQLLGAGSWLRKCASWEREREKT